MSDIPTIPLKMRKDQIRAIELYIEAAKTDDVMKQFLRTIVDRIEAGLKPTDLEGDK